MNYKIGELVNYEIIGSEKITGINVCKNGDYRFSLANGLTIDGQYITGLSEPVQPKQEDKPKFKVGDRVRVTERWCGHRFNIGEIVTLAHDGGSNWKCSNGRQEWFLVPREFEPYTEPESTEPKLIVTKRMLEEMGACRGGIEAFMENFPGGNGEFDEVIAKAREIERGADAQWLETRKRMVEEKQGEPKQEPVKLYCVKDRSNCVGTLTKGKVYEFISGSGLTYDNGAKSIETRTYERWARDNREASPHLVPLVSREAKVGEWVYLVNEPCVNQKGDRYAYACDFHKGDIVKITHFGTMPSVRTKRDGNLSGFRENEYLVLDGYTPELEKAEPTAADFKRAIAEIEMVQREHLANKAEPEYWSGRVVCVESINGLFTVGKPYEFNRYIKADNYGNPFGRGSICHPFKTLEAFNKWSCGAKFIEFKGE